MVLRLRPPLQGMTSNIGGVSKGQRDLLIGLFPLLDKAHGRVKRSHAALYLLLFVLIMWLLPVEKLAA